MTKHAVILVGISGSGKSTNASEYVERGYARIERDRHRETILITKIPNFEPKLNNIWAHWKWKWEDEVTKQWDYQLQACIDNSLDIVISDTNLNRAKVDSLKSKLELNGYVVEIYVIDVPLAECIERDKNRTNTVGEAVIYKQYMQLVENWNVRRRYVNENCRQKAIIVDIDGTLAHMEGKRGPFEWDKVNLDVVDEDTRQIVNMYYHRGFDVIIMSGRDGESYDMTWQWLVDNDILFDKMFMRAKGDQRKDWIVKEELFWNNVAGNWDVHLVIDDRKQVVMNTWHPLGLKVIQMGNAYLDF